MRQASRGRPGWHRPLRALSRSLPLKPPSRLAASLLKVGGLEVGVGSLLGPCWVPTGLGWAGPGRAGRPFPSLSGCLAAPVAALPTAVLAKLPSGLLNEVSEVSAAASSSSSSRGCYSEKRLSRRSSQHPIPIRIQLQANYPPTSPASTSTLHPHTHSHIHTSLSVFLSVPHPLPFRSIPSDIHSLSVLSLHLALLNSNSGPGPSLHPRPMCRM